MLDIQYDPELGRDRPSAKYTELLEQYITMHSSAKGMFDGKSLTKFTRGLKSGAKLGLKGGAWLGGSGSAAKIAGRLTGAGGRGAKIGLQAGKLAARFGPLIGRLSVATLAVGAFTSLIDAGRGIEKKKQDAIKKGNVQETIAAASTAEAAAL